MIASPNSLLSSAPIARIAVRLAPVPTRPTPAITRQLCHTRVLRRRGDVA